MKIPNPMQILQTVRSHWTTPEDGKYIPYKEFVAYSVGGIGVNTVNSLFGYVSLSANCLLLGSAYGLRRWIWRLCR